MFISRENLLKFLLGNMPSEMDALKKNFIYLIEQITPFSPNFNGMFKIHEIEF